MDYNVDKEKLANERVENAKKRVARVLNLLEVTSQELKWACESMKWNDDVAYQIEDAIIKLGPALATLVRWNDDADGTPVHNQSQHAAETAGVCHKDLFRPAGVKASLFNKAGIHPVPGVLRVLQRKIPYAG